MTAASTLLADPEWLAHRYVESGDAFRFARVPRADHAGAAFLTDDYIGSHPVGGDVPAADCLALPDNGTLHFLFHSAFCGSTLLTRALDRPGAAMGLSEPVVLNDVVGFRRRGGDPRAVARIADAATRLLGRAFGSGEAVVVKPSNVINPLAALLMALRPQARALFLFAPLDTFLTSVANKGLHCRIWARELLQGYLRDGALQGLGFEPDALFLLSDLQAAALGWLAQQRLMHDLAQRNGERLASLDADLMLARPEEAIAAVAGHYGLALGSDAIAEIVAGRAFSRHSKSGDSYSAASRAARYAEVRAAHGEEIGMVTSWIGAVAEAAGVSLAAPNPLLQA